MLSTTCMLIYLIDAWWKYYGIRGGVSQLCFYCPWYLSLLPFYNLFSYVVYFFQLCNALFYFYLILGGKKIWIDPISWSKSITITLQMEYFLWPCKQELDRAPLATTTHQPYINSYIGKRGLIEEITRSSSLLPTSPPTNHKF